MTHERRYPRGLAARAALPSLGTCPACGKRCYPDRGTAKAAARRSLPAEKPSAYRCGDTWHWGHLPVEVRNGTIDKDDWRDRVT